MNHRAVAAALVAASGLAVAGFAHAGADVGSYFVSPGILWMSPDNKLDADSVYGARLGFGKVINQNWDFELAYSDTKHSAGVAGPTGDFKLGFTEIDFKRVFRRDARFNPFLDVGIGLLTSKRQNVASSKSNAGALKLGLGFLAGAAQSARAQIVGDAGLRLDKFGAGIGRAVDPYIGLGVRLYLGGKPPVASAPPPAPAPAPFDSDGDGVPDNADRCPNTPAGARVDATGCELDGDRDSVVDRIDRCPNTPAGDKVDAVGCGLTIALQVNFDTASATIKSDSNAELDNFVEFLKAVPSARGALEGHTDSVGSDAYNQSLSQRRAESVKAYVVGKGIDGSRIEARGYGESRPVADNKTAEGRTQNRRVQFVRSSLQQ